VVEAEISHAAERAPPDTFHRDHPAELRRAVRPRAEASAIFRASEMSNARRERRSPDSAVG
jgi:hypothetical protein